MILLPTNTITVITLGPLSDLVILWIRTHCFLHPHYY